MSRDIKIRYQASVLGVIWSVLQPLFHLLVFTMLFKLILRVQVERFSSYAFIGILAYSWFHSSLSQSAVCVIQNRQLISRPNPPTRMLPIASVACNFVNFVIALPILIIFLWIEGTRVGVSLLLFPVVLLTQFAFILACAFLVSTINVFMRDTEHVLEIVLRMGYFMSPVFYSVERVPENWKSLYLLNPIVHFLGAYRELLLHNRIPDMISMGVILMGSLVALAVFVALFCRFQDRFVEEL